MLTAQQASLLAFLTTYQEEHGGVSPSFDEMAEAIGLTAKSGVHRLLCGLEERGFVRRLHGRARAIEVLPVQQNVSSFEAEKASRYILSAFNGYLNDPADSDFQRGHLSALLALYREGLGKGVGDDRLRLLDRQVAG